MTETHFLRLLVLLSIAFGQGIVANIFGHGSDTFPGKYELSNGPFNDWHYVEITSKSGNDYTWTNRAGVSWTLTFQKKIDDTHLSFSVGTDCPYYRQGYTEGFLFTETERGVQIQGPHKELYAKIVDCDCEFYSGIVGFSNRDGCKISKASPSGYKCKCQLNSGRTCSGEALGCSKRDHYCEEPDTSASACQFGGGNCMGYHVTTMCDCNYHPGGCKIVTAAPTYYKCVCIYRGLWTCNGHAKACNKWDKMCRNPDTSKDACVYGGGDCEGYKE